ncbi:hypothetical protein LTR12_013127 [Friedmanniomyces endolithicus]|nr:hypothetical protein LTR74_002028 [Friedmanniomyces endolithicus]KAK1812486.1 hypothetical protein LTR12_013127 [Friedmanniomyces endolithicus]
MSLEPKNLEAALPPSYSMATPTNEPRQTEQSQTLQQRPEAQLEDQFLKRRLENFHKRAQISEEAMLHWSFFLTLVLWAVIWLAAVFWTVLNHRNKQCSSLLGLLVWLVYVVGMVAFLRAVAGLFLDEKLIGSIPGSWSRGFGIGLRNNVDLLMLVPAVFVVLELGPACQARD